MPRRAFISLILRVSGNVNADIGVGTRIPLKKIITWNREVRPFVSARCIRRCIRERLSEKGFNIDPLQLVGPAARTERQQLGDVGNPVNYIDDDLFGFLKPEEVPIRRSSPIKISHLISLRHAEVKVEFATRFQREFLCKYTPGPPVPFEIELADWLGRLNVIISDRVGRFSDDELSEELKKQLGEKKSLSSEERKKRLRAFLEVLLWEGWMFPRGAQSPSVPEFYYAVIALSERFVPLFGYVDITEDGALNFDLIKNFRNLYMCILNKLMILDYRKSQFVMYYAQEGDKQESTKPESLNDKAMDKVINEICDYIVPNSE